MKKKKAVRERKRERERETDPDRNKATTGVRKSQRTGLIADSS